MAHRNSATPFFDFAVSTGSISLPVVADDWIVVAAGWFTADGFGATPISDGVNTYSLPNGADWTNPRTVGSGRQACWVAKATTTTTLTITVTLAAANTLCIVGSCFSGRDGTQAVEAAKSNYQVGVATSTDAITTATWTGTTGADIWGFAIDNNLAANINSGTGFTTRGGGTDHFEAESQDNVASGTRAATFTSSGAGQDVGTFGVSFKVAAGGVAISVPVGILQFASIALLGVAAMTNDARIVFRKA
jgi:hypothetical protein